MSLPELAPVAMVALGFLMLVMGLSTLGRVCEGSWTDRFKWFFISVSLLFAGGFPGLSLLLHGCRRLVTVLGGDSRVR